MMAVKACADGRHIISAENGAGMRRKRFFLYIFLIIFGMAKSLSAEIIVLDNPAVPGYAPKHIEFLEDQDKKYSISDVSSPAFSSKFKSFSGEVPNFSFTRSAYWIRLAVNNRAGSEVKWFLEYGYPLIDDIRLYLPDGKAGFLEKKSGRAYPFEVRDIRHRRFSFSLDKTGEGPQMLYLRVETKDSLVAPVSIRSYESVRSRDHKEQFLLGIYYGLVIVMILYNFFIFFAIRDFNYLFYLLTLVFVHGLYQLGINGLFPETLGLTSLWWTRTSIAVFFCAGMFFFLLFSKEFLRLKNASRVLNYIISGFMIVAAFQAVLSSFIDFHYAIQIAVIIGQFSAVLTLLAGLVSFFKGYRTARYYLLAWTALIIGGLIFSLKTWAVLPSNAFTEYAWQVGSGMQAILLAIALGDNINFLRKESDIAQKEALEKERLARETQEKFSEQLEKVVEERTNELNRVLESLRQKDKIIQEELNLAADMQRGLMPQTPIQHNGIRIVAYYSAMEKIGGDFYEIFYMKGGYICVLIGDVSGHGIPAAFITAMTKITFTEATRKYLFPKDIFRYANDQLLNIVHTQDYLTVFMVVISPSFEVFYSNASHPKALVFRNRFNEFEEWDTNGLFIGAVNEANDLYEEKHDMLDFGDRMVLYTDGLLEARNDKGDEFGIERLQEIMRKTKDLPLMDARAEIISYWYNFTEGELIKDDVTFLILEVGKEYRELLEHKNLGLEYLYQDKRKEAIEEFRRALSIDTTNIDLHYLLAKSYFKNGEFAKAAGHFGEYLNFNTEDAEALSMLAESQYRCNRYAEAIETSKRTCQIRPGSEQALLVWARALVSMQKIDEAKSILNQVIRINPQNGEAIDELKALA